MAEPADARAAPVSAPPLRRLAAAIAHGARDEERLRRSTLALSATLITALSCVWVGTYAALGLWRSAVIPLTYQVASVAGLLLLARRGRHVAFRRSQLAMMLALPFLLQWSLGGFVASSAVSLWAFVAPLGALLFQGARESVPWFLGFAALLAVSALGDGSLTGDPAAIPEWLRVTFFALNVGAVSLTAFLLLQYFVRSREHAYALLATEQERSERLLLNVLPAPIADRLKADERVIADRCDEVSVLFADLTGFTPAVERLPPEQVVELLDDVFSRFDALVERLGLEKIKTIGDGYMAAAGVPAPRPDHAQAAADLALAMTAALEDVPAAEGLTLRIGIDSGPVVAGVIGRRRFGYDLWGDTVNTASRMESHAPPGSIQVTARTYERLRSRYRFERRGAVDVKGKGRMDAYLLLGPDTQQSVT